LGDRSGLFITGNIVGWDEEETDWYNNFIGKENLWQL
jgi:hypothetical protein